MKIAICVPMYGDARATFFQSAMNMLAWAAKHMPEAEYKTFIARGSNLVRNRESLAASAIDWGADAVLWLDADHEFPKQALLRLLGHEKPVVAANYARRNPSGIIQPVAARDSLHVWSGRHAATKDELEAVDFTGLGLCLIRREVFNALERPWFASMPEDVNFFAAARAAGFEVLIDHQLSARVGHITERVLRLP